MICVCCERICCMSVVNVSESMVLVSSMVIVVWVVLVDVV